MLTRYDTPERDEAGAVIAEDTISPAVSRQAKGANLRHEVYRPGSISDSICQGLRKWHSHP